jgi:hypothetical protein
MACSICWLADTPLNLAPDAEVVCSNRVRSDEGFEQKVTKETKPSELEVLHCLRRWGEMIDRSRFSAWIEPGFPVGPNPPTLSPPELVRVQLSPWRPD